MNLWLIAASILLLCLAPCLLSCIKGDPLHRLIALEAAGVIVGASLILIAEGLHQPSFMDLALAFVLVNFGGNLAFARLLERWL